MQNIPSPVLILFTALLVAGIAATIDRSRRLRRKQDRRYTVTRRPGGFHSGGLVKGSAMRDDEIPVILNRGSEQRIYPGHPLWDKAIMPELHGRPIGPTEIVSEKTGNRYVAPPGFGFGRCECSVRDPIQHEEGCPLHGYPIMPELRRRDVAFPMSNPGRDDDPRFEVTSMPGVVVGEDGLARNEHDINKRLAPSDKPRWADCPGDDGEPLPPSMLHAPNIGSDDMPYAGRNYVEAEEIAEEMRGIRHYGTDNDAAV